MLAPGPTRAAALLAVIGVAWPAHAQVDEGVRLYEQAEFRGALEAFERALEDDLSRDELARLYLYRAQIRFALGDTAEMMRDAARLGGVDPQHELGPAVPPQVRQAFDDAVQLGAGLELEVTAEPMPHGARIVATTRGDPGDLVREVRIAARPVGRARWTEVVGETLEVPVPSGVAIEYRAWLVGEGRATLRDTGIRTHGGAAALASEERAPAPDSDAAGIPLWVMIGGGALAAVLIVGAIVLIAAAGPSDDTQIGPPTYVPP